MHILPVPSQASTVMQRLAIPLALVLTVFQSAPLRGDDWPQFRGPEGQGHAASDDVPIRWTSEENVRWKRNVPGSGWSSPSVFEGRIYLTSAVPSAKSKAPGDGDYTLNALCISAETGETIWNRELFRQPAEDDVRIHSKNSHASPTPIIDRRELYVHFGHQGTARLDLDGKVVWKKVIVDYDPVHGNGGSPILAGKSLIFSCDGAEKQWVVAADRDTGEMLWHQHRGTDYPRKFSFSTPLLIEVDGQQQVVSPGSGAVCAYDPATGNEIWRVRYPGYSVIPRPVYGHGLVYLSTGYGGATLLAIRPTGQGDVTDTHVAWQLSRGAPNTPSPLLVGDEIYLVSDRGIATCVDAHTGEIHWQERLGGSYSASPIYANGRVYMLSEKGVGTVLAAGTEFKKLAENDIQERTLASYAVADDALFIRSAEHLYRIEAR